jgi:hypothetical protein
VTCQKASLRNGRTGTGINVVVKKIKITNIARNINLLRTCSVIKSFLLLYTMSIFNFIWSVLYAGFYLSPRKPCKLVVTCFELSFHTVRRPKMMMPTILAQKLKISSVGLCSRRIINIFCGRESIQLGNILLISRTNVLWRAEPSSAVSCRVAPRHATPRLLISDSSKHLDDARVGRGHVTSAWRNNRRALFFRVSDQVLIGETEARLRVVLGGRLQSVHE